MKVGLRTPIPGANLRERVYFARRAGFDGIELGPEYMSVPTATLAQEVSPLRVTAVVGTVRLLDPDPAVRRDALRVERERLYQANDLGATALIEVPVFGEPRFDDLPRGVHPHAYARDVLIRALRELAPTIEAMGVTLLIEPLNRYETRFMNRLEQAAAICDAVGCPRVKILADFFHMSIEERDVAAAIRSAGERIGYVHVVDSNRREPGQGHTDFRTGFDALKSVGYDGWLTIESGILGVENGALIVETPEHAETALRRSRTHVETLWSLARG